MSVEVVLVVHRYSTVHPYLMVTSHPRTVITLGQLIVPLQVKRAAMRTTKYFLLHGVRTVGFTQSRQQKVNLLFRTYAKDSNPELREELMARASKMKPQEYLDWFRKTHPDDYLKLF